MQVINPIYIAVPVAGVCVLLALVIFAMYLLRRRNHHHHHWENYLHHHNQLHHHHHHPHHTNNTHKPPSSTHSSHIEAGGGGGGGGEGGREGCITVPLYQQHLHCDCVCQHKVLPPHCGPGGVAGAALGGGKVNRCTDSERSSSGSETRLFLQT